MTSGQSDLTELEQLPLADVSRLNTLCDEFLLALRQGERPGVEAFAERVEETLRPVLAEELIRLEVELRLHAGERPSAAELTARLPQWADRIDKVFRNILDETAWNEVRAETLLMSRDDTDDGEQPAHGRAAAESSSVSSASPPPADPTVALTAADPPRRTLGRYELLEVIGQGGMGVVFRARDAQLERDVAIKRLPPDLVRIEDARQRFLREARAAAAIRHPNVVTIHSVEEVDGQPFLVMELVEGTNLEQLIRARGKLPVLTTLHIAKQVADGLAAAHKRGLVHRDIKPANVLLEPSDSERGPLDTQSDVPSTYHAKISDFGLARAVQSIGLTQSGMIVGTPQYMSPEQADGSPVDHRSDLFSFGSVLYSMCAGRPAFTGDTAVAVLRQVADKPPIPIRQLNPDVPDWLAKIIETLMAKRRENRYESAAEVADLLGHRLAVLMAEAAASPTLITTGRRPRSQSPGRRPRWIRAALAAALFVIVAGVVVFQTADGEFVVTMNDPQIAASLGEKGVLIVEDRNSRRTYTLHRGSNRLPNGNYDLAVRTPDGLELDTPKFTIRRWSSVAASVVVRAKPASAQTVSSTAKPPPDPPRSAAPEPPRAKAPFDAAQATAHQQAWARHLGVEVEYTNALDMKFILIPPGEFLMGSSATDPGRPDERPQHSVTITRPFYAGVHEVTVGQFRKFVEATGYQTQAEAEGNKSIRHRPPKGEFRFEQPVNWQQPDFEQTDEHPVVHVSWNDAVAFCDWLTRTGGLTCRLPTEAEWEYFCRAGTLTQYFWGNDKLDGETFANVIDAFHRELFTELPSTGQDWRDGYAQTAPVAFFRPNPFGLRDVAGNVWEWCADRYAADYYAVAPVNDPAGPDVGATRVLRGGSWHTPLPYCRSSNRDGGSIPDVRYDHIGFRVVLVGDLKAKPSSATVSLFNGKNLDGWGPPQGEGTWEVIDGVMTGQAEQGMGVMEFASQDFDLFKLRAEVRVTGPGNSGFYFYPKPRDGYHFEIGSHPDGQSRTGSIAQAGDTFEWLADQTHERAAEDAWVTLEIVRDGTQLSTKVDGRSIVTLFDTKPGPGKLSLELYALSGPVKVEFRKIELDVLLPAPEPNRSTSQASTLQSEFAQRSGLPVEYVHPQGMRFRLIPPGEFRMGFSDEDSDPKPEDQPQHTVTITKPFYLGETEVTLKQFRTFVDQTGHKTLAETNGRGSVFKGTFHTDWNWRNPAFHPVMPQDDHPVTCVAWSDAQAMCEWLSQQDAGRTYRLPTDAEWEYACRAGTTTAFSFGNSPDPNLANSNEGGQPFGPVREFPPNPFGLYDMHGSVWEWCQDGRRTYSAEPVSDPLGPTEVDVPRVVRGGAVSSGWNRLRSAVRLTDPPDHPSPVKGFRVALNIPASS